MKLSVFASLLAAFSLTVSCNNQRSNRLSATHACDSSVRSVDPTSFGLTEWEEKNRVYTPIDLDEFPDEEEVIVTSIVTTIELALGNEEKSTIRLSQRPSAAFSAPSIDCVKNMSLDSSGETTVSIPFNNKNGRIETKNYKITIGKPLREDKSDFLRLELVPEEVTESSNSELEEPESDPAPFTTYFSEEGSSLKFFKLTPPKGKRLNEVEEHNQNYFVHFKNDLERLRSRIVVRRLKQKEKKK